MYNNYEHKHILVPSKLPRITKIVILPLEIPKDYLILKLIEDFITIDFY